MIFRFGAILAFVLALGAPLRGQEVVRQAQIGAAISEALDSLHREIASIPFGKDFTAGALVERTNSQDQIDALCQKAEQIGGARWLDDQTVEVRMELSGDAVEAVLQTIAEQHTNLLPMPLHQVREELKRDVAHHIFAATGASTAGRAADRLRPDLAQTAWRNVSDADRRGAIDAARGNAIQRVMDSLREVEWDYGKKRLANVISTRAASTELGEWLASRPITRIEFRDDLEVRISLAASFRDLWPVLKGMVAQSPLAPKDAKEWEALHRQAERRVQPAVGAAVVRGAPAPVVTIALPANPPAWSLESLAADAAARPVDNSKLKTARVAEAAAVQSLSSQINGLPLFRNLTVGAAASKDVHIAAAISRALEQARIARVEYDTPAPGAVRVQMTLDLQILWRELTR